MVVSHQISTELNRQLIAFRQDLHQHPELSGQEQETAARLQTFLRAYEPAEILTKLGGQGVAAVYVGAKPGPTVVLRSDMDGLPIAEVAQHDHSSQRLQVSHACGHDGHMTMVAGLAALLQQQPIARGKVVLLFQPAEETGAGAAQVVVDPRFVALQPDYVFGLHNLPRMPLGQVVWRPGSFAAASQGAVIRLDGKPSHAAYPEHGVSPALAMAELVAALTQLPQIGQFEDFVLVTVVHALLGAIAFGTAPGNAEVRATLRSYQDGDMARLVEAVIQLATNIATNHGLTATWEWQEVFPATTSHPEALAILESAIATCSFDSQVIAEPFRWSEDFGHYTQRHCGALFGLGSGVDQPQLHNENYDFPDELIPYGVTLFEQIVRQILATA